MTQKDENTTYSPDIIHHILRNRRRRAVLFYLKYHDTPVTMRELSREIAAWEFDTDPELVSSEQRERVYVSLHQTHLPTLNEKGIIDYDKDRQIIERDEGLWEFEPYIDPQKVDDVGKLINVPQTVYAGIQQDVLEDTKVNRLLRYLTPEIDSSEKWSAYYLGAAAIGGLLILLASPLTSFDLPMTFAAVVQTGLVTAIAFVHVFVESEPDEIATAEEMFLGRLRPEWADEYN